MSREYVRITIFTAIMTIVGCVIIALFAIYEDSITPAIACVIVIGFISWYAVKIIRDNKDEE